MTSNTTSRVRRDEIMAVALRLFRERGYQYATIDAIGAGAGITGPAVYRHFSSKGALLADLFEVAIERLTRGAIQAESEFSGSDLLRRLICNHVQFAVSDRDLITVYAQEERSLPESERRRLRNRQRDYVNVWVHGLRVMRSDLSEASARDMAYALIALIASPANHVTRSSVNELRVILSAMAISAAMSDLTEAACK